MSVLRRNLHLIAASALLFVCVIPLSYRHLFWQMNPVSVLHGDYFPLIRRLPDFWDHHYQLWTIALVTGLLLVTFIAVVMRCRGFTFLQTVGVLAGTVTVALLFQYSVIVQLDKYLEAFFGHGWVPDLAWFFDWSALRDCFLVAAGYSCIAAVLAMIVWVIWRRLPQALTKRCSQPLAGASSHF
jgi:hypothetical protein